MAEAAAAAAAAGARTSSQADRETPTTPVADKSHRAGGRKPAVILEARPPTPRAQSPAQRQAPCDSVSKGTFACIEHGADSWRMHRAEEDSDLGGNLLDTACDIEITDADMRARGSSAGMLSASSPRGYAPHSSVGSWRILTEAEVTTIFLSRLERSGNRRSQLASKLAEQFGVAPRTIRDIWNLRTWVKTTRPLWSNADLVEAKINSQKLQSSRHNVEDFNGWKLCPCWLVPGEALERDEFDAVLDKILASDAAEAETAERKEAAAGANASSSACHTHLVRPCVAVKHASCCL